MAKKSLQKNINKTFNTSPALPGTKNIDELSIVSDDELFTYLDMLTLKVKENRQTRDLQEWEKEVCYAQREFQIRAIRRRSHDSFLENENMQPVENEDYYPEAELDNVEFVNLARRIEATRERARNRERRSQFNPIH
jgi:hypothetical protein